MDSPIDNPPFTYLYANSLANPPMHGLLLPKDFLWRTPSTSPARIAVRNSGNEQKNDPDDYADDPDHRVSEKQKDDANENQCQTQSLLLSVMLPPS